MRTIIRGARFAICITATPEDDLETGKVYGVLPDAKGNAAGCLRVIDDSGEDYLYPASWFVVVDVPPSARRQIWKALQREPV